MITNGGVTWQGNLSIICPLSIAGAGVPSLSETVLGPGGVPLRAGVLQSGP